MKNLPTRNLSDEEQKDGWICSTPPKQRSTAPHPCADLPWLPPNQLVQNELEMGASVSERRVINEGEGAKTETEEAV